MLRRDEISSMGTLAPRGDETSTAVPDSHLSSRTIISLPSVAVTQRCFQSWFSILPSCNAATLLPLTPPVQSHVYKRGGKGTGYKPCRSGLQALVTNSV